MTDERVSDLLARYIEQHVLRGSRPSAEELCVEHPELVESLRDCIRQYEQLERTFEATASIRTPDAAVTEQEPPPATAAAMPTFEGFRTIERLGRGGGGEVYKLQDLELGRAVAAKVIRPDNPLGATIEDFLREARSLALFEDPRIVRLFEFRRHADPPVLLMEFVDGFRLDRIGRSLEYARRARVMAEIAEAIHHAHALGIEHRDLKPANIILDARLSPRILDFGLSGRDPHRGRGVGTPAYMAPEHFQPGGVIDARTDIYALGVIFYELLCGALPFTGETHDRIIASICAGEPRLPIEVQSDVPEALQAIALKAMEKNAADRYASAREMALELKRFLDDKPVLARPTIYCSALKKWVTPHLEQIREWRRIKLIYPHEADRLLGVYRNLEAREDDWIVESRSLSYSQISLYLGAFLLLCGSCLYFIAYVSKAIDGLAKPSLVLAAPFVVLNIAAYMLYRRERKAVAVAFQLSAAALLPVFLVILCKEVGLWPANPDNEHELLRAWLISNRQLQVATLAACLWALRLALTTRTVALSACFTALAFTFNFAVLADLDLRSWLDTGRHDLLALHLLPLLAVTWTLGCLGDRSRKPWFARPLYLASACLFTVILELLALHGRAFEYLGLSMVRFNETTVRNPTLLDTVTAMTINGVIVYGVAWVLDTRGSELMKTSASLLYRISPFAMLEPLFYLNGSGEYSRRFAWLYLALAVTITFLSHYRQRKSFYYAGLINTGAALLWITDHHDWFDQPAWAATVVGVGLLVLAMGLVLNAYVGRRSGR